MTSQTTTDENVFTLTIMGGGLAGITAAAILSKHVHSVAWITPKPTSADERTTALFHHSISYLKQNKIWDKIESNASAIGGIRLIDATSRLFRSDEHLFRSSEIDLDVFGYNMTNRNYNQAVQQLVKQRDNITQIKNSVAQITENEESLTCILDDGTTICAHYLIGADGRNSLARQSTNKGKGIATRQWTYPQSALVGNFEHEYSHDNISTEFHTPHGPFTLVPLESRKSALVWVTTPDRAEQIVALSPEGISRETEAQMQSFLGKVKFANGLQKFPLSSLVADQCAQGRTFLIGESSHAFPPIGAQGFNLTLRDIEALQTLLANRREDNLSQEPLLCPEHYNSMRKRDILSRIASVDVLNRSLLAEFLPAQMIRMASFSAFSSLGPLRRFLLREGVEPGRGVENLRQRLNPGALLHRMASRH